MSPLLPEQYSRDQFLKSLRLVMDSSVTAVERLYRERMKLNSYDMESIKSIQAVIAPFKKIISVEQPGGPGGIHVCRLYCGKNK